MNEQCKGCYREEARGCPAFDAKDKPNPCWARITDREQYIKEQRELIAFNRARFCSAPAVQAERNIKRATKGGHVDG